MKAFILTSLFLGLSFSLYAAEYKYTTSGDITSVIGGSGVTVTGGDTGDATVATTYSMDQDVLTTSSVTFSSMTLTSGMSVGDLSADNVAATYGVTGATAVFSGAMEAATLDTGQGANELYDMDQNVLTSSVVTFASATVTNQVNSASFKIGANDLTTSEWANLDGIDQSVATSDTVTFASATVTNQVNSASFKIGANDLTTTEWANLDGVNQSLATGDGVTFATVDTGQGANELYDMNQHVLTTSDVSFATMTVSNAVSLGTTTLTASEAIKFSVTVDTTSAPSAAGILGKAANNSIWKSSGTGAGAWEEFGAGGSTDETSNYTWTGDHVFTTTATFQQEIVVATGTTRAITFGDDTDTYLKYDSANNFSVWASGNQVMKIDGTNSQILIPNGTVSNPGLAIASDVDNGIIKNGTNGLAIVCGGSQRVNFGTTWAAKAVYSSSKADPQFRGPQNNQGMYSSLTGDDVTGLAAGGKTIIEGDENAKVVIGNTSTKAGTLKVYQENDGSEVFRLQTAQANNDALYIVYQSTFASVDNTTGTVVTFALTDDSIYMFETRTIARRTGGAAGAAGDCASYVRHGAFKREGGGGATAVGTVATTFTAEDNANLDVYQVVDGNNVLIRVQGDTNNDYTWHVTTMIQNMSN